MDNKHPLPETGEYVVFGVNLGNAKLVPWGPTGNVWYDGNSRREALRALDEANRDLRAAYRHGVLNMFPGLAYRLYLFTYEAGWQVVA